MINHNANLIGYYRSDVRKTGVTIIQPNPIQSTKFRENSDQIQPKPIRGWFQPMSNSGLDPRPQTSSYD